MVNTSEIEIKTEPSEIKKEEQEEEEEKCNPPDEQVSVFEESLVRIFIYFLKTLKANL